MPPSDAERLIELETRFLHLERLVDELNQVIIRQASQLDQLQRASDELVDQARSARAAGKPDGSDEPPPPHY